MSDVKEKILTDQDAVCPHCGHEAKIGKLNPSFSDRAGMTLIECKCRRCFRTWRRVIAKMLEAA